jgi:hypothetical protein
LALGFDKSANRGARISSLLINQRKTPGYPVDLLRLEAAASRNSNHSRTYKHTAASPIVPALTQKTGGGGASVCDDITRLDAFSEKFGKIFPLTRLLATLTKKRGV